MHTYNVVLFLHIATLLAAISLAGILHSAEWRQRGSTTIQELRILSAPYKWGALFPILIILLLAEGMYLVHLSHDEFDLGDGWVWTAIVALAILFASGGAVLDRHAKKYATLLALSADGPITDEARAAAFDRTAWAVSHMNTALAVGVVFNMVNKPGPAGAVIVLVVAMALGTGIGLAGARKG